MKNLAILGTRGIPARDGGFETFAEELAVRLVEMGVVVTVYCEAGGAGQQYWRFKQFSKVTFFWRLNPKWTKLLSLLDGSNHGRYSYATTEIPKMHGFVGMMNKNLAILDDNPTTILKRLLKKLRLF